jgi:hypothetical protein
VLILTWEIKTRSKKWRFKVLKYGVFSQTHFILTTKPSLFIEFFINKVLIAFGVCLIFWVLISVETSWMLCKRKTLISVCGNVKLYNIDWINLTVKLNGTSVRDLAESSP